MVAGLLTAAGSRCVCRSVDSNSGLPSDAEEDFALVHPVEEIPIDQHDGDAEQERLKSGAEDLEDFVAEVNVEGVDDELFPQMRDEVRCNRVHADDDEREGPLAVVLHVDNPRKGDEEEEADAAAEECPAWCPHALDDGADSSEVKEQAGGEERKPGDEEFAEGDERGGGAEPLSGKEA